MLYICLGSAILLPAVVGGMEYVYCLYSWRRVLDAVWVSVEPVAAGNFEEHVIAIQMTQN